MDLGFSPPHRGKSSSPIAWLWVLITRVFLLQLFTFNSFQEGLSCSQSVTVTSLARHQLNVMGSCSRSSVFGERSSSTHPRRSLISLRSPPQPDRPPTSLFSRLKKSTHGGNSEAGSSPAALIRRKDQLQATGKRFGTRWVICATAFPRSSQPCPANPEAPAP